MQRKLGLLGVAAVIAIVAVVAVACSDNDEPTHTGPDNGDILAALATLDAASLHHIENTLINDEPAIDPTWIGPLRNARTAVALIEWPEELHDASQAFLDESVPLLEALEADDLEGAAAVATTAHTAWHLLKDPGYAYLAEQAGTGSGGGESEEHGHDDD